MELWKRLVIVMKKQHEYLYGKTGDTMYLFYLKGPIMNDILRESIESELELSVPEMEEIYREKDIYPYALTFDKSMADDFINSRNGERFILKTEDVSDKTHEEIEKFKSSCRYAVLSRAELYTASYRYGIEADNPEYPNIVSIILPVTSFENDIIQMQMEGTDERLAELSDEASGILKAVKCLKKKYRDIIKMSGLLSIIVHSKSIQNQYSEFGKLEKLDIGIFSLDEISVLMDICAELF